MQKQGKMNVQIEETWRQVLQPQFDSPYFERLTAFVRQAYQTSVCYPPGRQIFEAFRRTPFPEVKVVILGQDPYHGPGQAHGLCFSVQQGIQPPPSLQNIYKELCDEYNRPGAMGSVFPTTPRVTALPQCGDLSGWADQGVLLLNATLTVQAAQAGSHQGKGWETFTDAAIQALAQQREHVVFMLWGSYAQRKGSFIDRSRHLVLETAHPSPLSAYRGFFGCQHFAQANAYLMQHGMSPIQWL